MPIQENETCDVDHVVLRESTDSDTQSDTKSRRNPKRVLQFSDGTLEEYSSDDEVDAPKEMRAVTQLDVKSLDWLPWAWHQTLRFSTKMLDGCDYAAGP
ncbi:hypothetical protein KM043_014781 [Ampulex compressa]|nr:hypothetical protein KM043_014781 [Ampulex compressa]